MTIKWEKYNNLVLEGTTLHRRSCLGRRAMITHWQVSVTAVLAMLALLLPACTGGVPGIQNEAVNVTTEYDKVKAAYDKAIVDLTTAQSQTKAFQGDNDSLKASQEKAKQDLGNALARNVQLERDLKDAQSRLDTTETRLRSLQGEYETLKATYEKTPIPTSVTIQAPTPAPTTPVATPKPTPVPTPTSTPTPTPTVITSEAELVSFLSTNFSSLKTSLGVTKFTFEVKHNEDIYYPWDYKIMVHYDDSFFDKVYSSNKISTEEANKMADEFRTHQEKLARAAIALMPNTKLIGGYYARYPQGVITYYSWANLAPATSYSTKYTDAKITDFGWTPKSLLWSYYGSEGVEDRFLGRR